MPIIQFNLLEGRTVEQKRELARRVTQTVVEVLGCKPEQVRILIHQMTADDFAIAGVTAAERAAVNDNGAHLNGAEPTATRVTE